MHSAHDWRRVTEALGREHGEAGDRLCQLEAAEGWLIGVLVGCVATWHLRDGDQTAGAAVTRSERLKRVMQLRRFLVLAAARRPNLATQCLGRDHANGSANGNRNTATRPENPISLPPPSAIVAP